jgi:Arc/MetJ family transcription regulator
VTRTVIDLDDDLVARAAQELGTATKKDTVHAALRAVLRAKAASALLAHMAATTNEDEALVNDMWEPT